MRLSRSIGSYGALSQSLDLVLHPGHPKCGSSSIQFALWSNISTLRERGILVPEQRPNRVFTNACIRGNAEVVDRWLDKLVRQAIRHRCTRVVISAENLAVQPIVNHWQLVHGVLALRFRTVRVIHYIRRQDDWIMSMWQQWGHKQGLSLPQFIDNQLSHDQPGFLTAARCFEAAYGEGSVSVVPLVPQALKGGDLVADFCERAGVPPLVVEGEGRRRNVSMGGYLCDVLSRVPLVYDQNRVSLAATGITDTSVRRLLERSSRSKDLLFSSDKRILSTEQRRNILACCEAENRSLHKRYFADLAFQDVFGLPAVSKDDDLRVLHDRVDGLRDVVALQMELIVKLLRERERRSLIKGLARRARSWRRRLSA